MLKTAWERLLVSFMLVAATVLKKTKIHAHGFLKITTIKSKQLILNFLPGLVSRIHQVLDVIVGGDG